MSSSFGGARPKTTGSSGSSRGVLPSEDEPEGTLEEDYVYTYTGGDVLLADLPKSLYGIHLSSEAPPPVSSSSPRPGSNSPLGGAPQALHAAAPAAVPIDQESPDMDFLEMDFDENVSESPSVSLHLEEEEEEEDEEEDNERLATEEVEVEEEGAALPLRSAPPSYPSLLSPPSGSSRSPSSLPHLLERPSGLAAACPPASRPEAPLNGRAEGEALLSKRNNDPSLDSPSTEEPKETTLLEKTMIWSEDEVETKGAWPSEPPDASGIVAVINALRALNHHPDRLEILNHFNSLRSIHQEEEDSSLSTQDLPSFLFSYSTNSPNYKDLISVVSLCTKGTVCGRFFPTFPRRKFVPSLSSWLTAWIRKGAVPVAAMNVRGEKELLPGSWHYSMIHGVGPSGVYGTNPTVCATEKFFVRYLSHPSQMAVDKSDILRRWHTDTDLTPLRDTKDSRWRDLNVLGQVIHTLREECQRQHSGGNTPEYIRIPCNHSCGIILFMNQDSEYVKELLNSSELGEETLTTTTTTNNSNIKADATSSSKLHTR